MSDNRVTLREQIRCVERELTMRSRVYAGLVDRRKMTPHEAEREITTMGQVLKTLQACEQLADVLEEAPRQHIAAMHQVEKDMPEGTLFIAISDTLAKQLIEQLRGLAPNPPGERAGRA
jgi:hypothetical protein